MHSSCGKRAGTSGFTLLEALVSIGILSIVVVSIYGLTARSLLAQKEAELRYELALVAQGVLDEYIVTYPSMVQNGQYAGQWEWEVFESDAEPLFRTDVDDLFRFVRVTVIVEHLIQTEFAYELSTVVARRGEDR